MTNINEIEQFFVEMYYEGSTIDNLRELSEGIMETVYDQISKCNECGEKDCEWLQENEGTCCKDNDNVEPLKGCPPCNEDKLADMIDTQRDIEKDRSLEDF